MRRREFIAGLGGVAAWPVVARAQGQANVQRIGYLGSGSPASSGHYAASFRDALGKLGYVEGRNVLITYRWAKGRFDQLPALINELLREKPDVIIAFGGPEVTGAIKSATSTIPVVFLTDDPVAEGVVDSLARPGGNLTGVSVMQNEAEVKRIQLIKDALPNAARIAVLRNPDRPRSVEQLQTTQEAGSVAGLEVTPWDVASINELDRILSRAPVEPFDALLVTRDPMLFNQRMQIVEFAARNHLPGFYFWREFVEVGGLISYGPNPADIHRRMASYVAKILKGAKPADLPVEQPTKFELVINLKAAKAIGLTVPPALVARADEVIE
jgi:putative tryptophan/tyrosine transport system substrate-binding protein